MELQELNLALLRIDGGTQQRVRMSDSHVKELTDALVAGKPLTPAVVFFDGKDYWLADGFHTREAYRANGSEAMPVDVRPGTKRDAILYSVGANASHGLKRTNEDKEKAVKVLLADAEWGQWSDGRIAESAGVTDRFVAAVRSRTTPNGSESNKNQETRIGKDGRSYKVKPKVKKKTETQPASEPPKEVPKPKPPKTTDHFGIPIQPHAVNVFAATVLFDEILAKLKECRKLYATLAEQPGGVRLLQASVSINAKDKWENRGIENAILSIEDARPYMTVCPYEYNPEHAHEEDCTLCKGLRWAVPFNKGRVPADLIAAAKEAFGV